MIPKEPFYKAYKNAFKMMILRGYQTVNRESPVEAVEFETLRNKMGSSEGWIRFIRGKESVYLAVATGSVSIHVARAVLDEMYKLGKRTYLLYVHANDGFSNDAQKALSACPPSRNKPRSESAIRSALTIELVSVDSMQFNPLKYGLQPAITLITDERAKEALRQGLVSVLDDKTTRLEDLLPLISVEGQICRWHDAHVGDVFYFHRTLGGEQAYYRIVRQEIHGRIKGKAFKVKGEKTAEEI